MPQSAVQDVCVQFVPEIAAMNWWTKFKLRKRSRKLISKSLADYLLSCIKQIAIGGTRVSYLIIGISSQYDEDLIVIYQKGCSFWLSP